MKEYINQGSNDTRSGFGEGLTELGRTNPHVVALCADLIGSLKMQKFIDENPTRFFQVGIAEALQQALLLEVKFLLQEHLPIFQQEGFMIKFANL